jgi:hypothetical protein
MPWTINPSSGDLEQLSVQGANAGNITVNGDSGSATTAAGIMSLLTSDTTTNNDNGITGIFGASTGTLYLTNRATATVTTADATPTTALSFSLGATPGVFFLEGNIVAYDVTDVAGGSYSFTSGMRTDGASATELGSEFKDSFEELAMQNADFNIVTSGNNVIVQVVGILAKTIHWNVYLTYRFVS